MSHFSQVKTNIKNRTTLEKALKNLGHEIVSAENNASVEVRGFFGETETADFKILTDTHYDIGFRKLESGEYEAVGDWSLLPKVSGIKQEEFLTKVKREYAKTAIIELAEEKGYEIEMAENGESTELVVSQW